MHGIAFKGSDHGSGETAPRPHVLTSLVSIMAYHYGK